MLQSVHSLASQVMLVESKLNPGAEHKPDTGRGRRRIPSTRDFGGVGSSARDCRVDSLHGPIFHGFLDHHGQLAHYQSSPGC